MPPREHCSACGRRRFSKPFSASYDGVFAAYRGGGLSVEEFMDVAALLNAPQPTEQAAQQVLDPIVQTLDALTRAWRPADPPICPACDSFAEPGSSFEDLE